MLEDANFRCPKCKKHAMIPMLTQRYIIASGMATNKVVDNAHVVHCTACSTTLYYHTGGTAGFKVALGHKVYRGKCTINNLSLSDNYSINALAKNTLIFGEIREDL